MKQSELTLISSNAVKRLIESPIIPAHDQERARAAAKVCLKAESGFQVRGYYRQADHPNILILPSFHYFAAGCRVKEYSVVQIGLANSFVWEQEVYNKQMDIIDGRLVLAVVERVEREATVLLVEQGRGMSIQPAIARVVLANGTTWKLESKPNIAHPALDILCTKQDARTEITDKLYEVFMLYRYRPVLEEMEDLFLNPDARRTEPMIVRGSDEIN